MSTCTKTVVKMYLGFKSKILDNIQVILQKMLLITDECVIVLYTDDSSTLNHTTIPNMNQHFESHS